MARLKRLIDYPEEYYKLFRKAHSEDVTIPFNERRKAITFRTELYNFRVAARQAAKTDDKVAQELLFLEQIILSIKNTDLVLSKKDTVHAERIREVLSRS